MAWRHRERLDERRLGIDAGMGFEAVDGAAPLVACLGRLAVP
jgi:hypothetical protein